MNTMNNNKDDEGAAAAEMEARIMAWVSGEASPAEAAELESLAGARPEIAALKQRVESLLRLASEATASDREPLRFSTERRRGAPSGSLKWPMRPVAGRRLASEVPAIPQIPMLMRRANLAFAAVFSIALIAGVTWWGEQSHYKAALRTPAVTPATELFTVKPEDPVPVEVDDAPPKAKTNEVSPPSLPEVPAKPSIDSITQPIEPPHAVVDLTMTKISTDTDSGRAGDKLYKLSDLDQAPEATFQARPTYPFELRRAGTTGEVTVDFIVDANGNVRNVYAAHSSRQEFEQAACTAVSHWKFRPGRKGGRAVNVHMQVPILFTLSADGGP